MYMDDIIVYSPTIHEQKVAYLGHLITKEEVKPNTSKVESIKKFQKYQK